MNFTNLAVRLPGKLLVAAGVLALSIPALADNFSVQYFSVTESNLAGSDFHPGGVSTGTLSTNYVSGGLSGGMPVYNPGHTGTTATDNPTNANDFVSGNVLGWWTPGSYDSGNNVVTSTGSGPLTVSTDPTTPTSMFPPNSTGLNDTNAEETAILTGTFDLSSPGSVTFGISADDDAFIFVDGQYVGGLGGIHGISSTLTDFTATGLTSGVHTVQIFYADQDQVLASLAVTSSVPVGATPEPGSLALLGTGVLGIAGTIRRRLAKS